MASAETVVGYLEVLAAQVATHQGEQGSGMLRAAARIVSLASKAHPKEIAALLSEMNS